MANAVKQKMVLPDMTDISKTKVPESSKTVRISGSEAVVKSLLAEGVKTLFGFPGGAIMPVYDELYKYQRQLHHVLTRHEQGAVDAAQ